jgi:hypothetical protein
MIQTNEVGENSLEMFSLSNNSDSSPVYKLVTKITKTVPKEDVEDEVFFKYV